MRVLVAATLFAAAAVVLAAASPDPLAAQDKKAAPKADPKTFVPDAATLQQIKEKTEELRKAIASLKEKKLADDVLVEVEIYLKAAENIVRFEEWLAKDSVKWTFATLEQGLARAKQAEGGKAVWRDAPGKWVVRAYRSNIDDSVQPYAVLLPLDYGRDAGRKWRLDIVLHGRDGSLTEAKFITQHNGNAPKGLDYIQLEPYGRGNNAYRWAGEKDVFEAWTSFKYSGADPDQLDDKRVVLRGFSMGGAGAWHIGLRHPDKFCVIGPGAGFTTTHGYIANLPKELPEYQEKCLRIYDAVGYAENVFNVPVVAYSGEKDAQKRAADNIENALKGFKEPFQFKHLVAPGLEHQMPKEWQEKAEAEYRRFADMGRDPNPQRIRLVTYTPHYEKRDWLGIASLEKSYEKAVVDAIREGKRFALTTRNVRLLTLSLAEWKYTVTIDGQQLNIDGPDDQRLTYLEKRDGKWAQTDTQEVGLRTDKKPEKWRAVQGPIDDAFKSTFVVVGPTADGYPAAALKQFAALWDRYFRGALPTSTAAALNEGNAWNLVLFGTPDTNPLIAKVLPKLPITWTKEKLVVNGVEYDPKTHLPVLIYPNPLAQNLSYVVINSGHTFGEGDLKGTNALLYPRLGDWAVIKPAPTAKDPAAYEVVAAGLFDENWQFPAKK